MGFPLLTGVALWLGSVRKASLAFAEIDLCWCLHETLIDSLLNTRSGHDMDVLKVKNG